MKGSRRSTVHNWAMVSILIAASSCGGGGGGEGAPPVTVSTLAYVVTECRGDAEALTIRQSLQIRQGEQAPITVVEHSAHVPGAGFYCGAVGVPRQGSLFAELGVFRRLGV